MNDNQPRFTRKPLALAVALAASATPIQNALAAAGKVSFAWGDVKVQDASGSQSALKRGSELENGDTVITEKGRAQLRFKDGSFISLQPKSTFKIEDYNYEESAQANDKSVFSLFRGGLRTITGLIGKRNRGAYRVNTPVATIGIRGTAYTMMLQGDGSLALECADGQIFAANDGGTTFYNAGDVGVVLNKFTVPKVVQGDEGEQLLVLSPPAREVKEEAVEEIGDDGETDTVTLNITGLEPEEIFDVLIEAGLSEEQAGDLLGDVFDDFIPPTSDNPAEIVLIDDGSGMAVASTYLCDICESVPFNEVESPVTTDFVTGTGQLESWTRESDGFKTSARGDLAFADTGADDIIAWGRWTFSGGGNFTYQDSARDFNAANESLHYVVGTPTDISTLMNDVRFSVLGHTTPTAGDGTTGTFVDATLKVDFANDQVDGSVKFNMVGNNYELIFANLDATGGVFRGPDGPGELSDLSGCGMSACFCGGLVSGIVAGPNADRAGFVFHAEDSSNPFGQWDMFGGVTFKQDPNGAIPPPIPPL